MLESSRLLRPTLFLFIKTKRLWLYCWLYPITWLCVICSGLYLCPISIKDKLHLIETITISCGNILTILPGFYIAALAAIATFQAPSMDTPLDGNKAWLNSRENGEVKRRKLTRRRFLSLLFSYLSFLSLILFFSNIFINIPTNILSSLNISCDINNSLIILLYFIFGLFFIQLIILTLFGLFYLGDRIHWKKVNYTSNSNI